MGSELMLMKHTESLLRLAWGCKLTAMTLLNANASGNPAQSDAAMQGSPMPNYGGTRP